MSYYSRRMRWIRMGLLEGGSDVRSSVEDVEERRVSGLDGGDLLGGDQGRGREEGRGTDVRLKMGHESVSACKREQSSP